MNPFRSFLLLFTAGLLLSGCTDLRPNLPEARPDDLPQLFIGTGGDDPLPRHWWHAFANPELNRLIDDGLDHNRDLEQAWARLLQAQALADKAGAELRPSASAEIGAAHLRRESDGEAAREDDFSFGLAAGYEVDLWGRIHAETKSAVLTAKASREDVSTTAFTVSGEIAQIWINLLASRQREQQLRYQLTLNRDLLDLIELRFAMAKSSALDIYQQQQTVNGIEGGLITVRAQQEVLRRQLALLTGKAVDVDLSLNQVDYPPMPSLPDLGLPVDLLARRPDLRAAALRLEGAVWDVAAARADRLPKLLLTGTFGSNSSILEQLLDSWLLRLAADLAGPLYDGGSRKAEVDRNKAAVMEKLSVYRQAVHSAITEVEDALTRERQYRQTRDNVSRQIELNQRAYREATWRYLGGQSDFLPVLQEQLNLIGNQLDLIQAGSDLLSARIALYRALGGAWPDGLEQPADPLSPLTAAPNSSPVSSVSTELP